MDRASRPEGNVADVQPGWDVYSADEQKVGNVDRVEQNYIVAHKGIFFAKDLYIPLEAVRRFEHDRVYLNIVKDEVDGQGWDTEPMPTPGGVRADRGTDTGGQTLHLHEEELRANKERAQAGEVRLGKEVVERQETVNVPVTREEVFIERRPGDHQPDDHDIGEGGEETVRVPISEEQVEVEKVPVMTEEVRVGKREVTENRQVTDTVRRERARIEKEGDIRVQDADQTLNEKAGQ
jgi:uncharacterized protein (TIGR02271 family)